MHHNDNEHFRNDLQDCHDVHEFKKIELITEMMFGIFYFSIPSFHPLMNTARKNSLKEKKTKNRIKYIKNFK